MTYRWQGQQDWGPSLVMHRVCTNPLGVPQCATLPFDGGSALDVPLEHARSQHPEEGAADVRGVRNPPRICFHHRSHLVQHLGDQPEPDQHKRRHVGDVHEEPEEPQNLDAIAGVGDRETRP